MSLYEYPQLPEVQSGVDSDEELQESKQILSLGGAIDGSAQSRQQRVLVIHISPHRSNI